MLPSQQVQCSAAQTPPSGPRALLGAEDRGWSRWWSGKAVSGASDEFSRMHPNSRPPGLRCDLIWKWCLRRCDRVKMRRTGSDDLCPHGKRGAWTQMHGEASACEE